MPVVGDRHDLVRPFVDGEPAAVERHRPVPRPRRSARQCLRRLVGQQYRRCHGGGDAPGPWDPVHRQGREVVDEVHSGETQGDGARFRFVRLVWSSGKPAARRRVPVDMRERSPDITVYWRPGCGFCSALIRQLESKAVPHQQINIWDDPRAAATVRAAARGNETVPTVIVGPVALVNPRLDDVLSAATEYAPHAVPDDWSPKQKGRLARWLLAKLDTTSAAA